MKVCLRGRHGGEGRRGGGRRDESKRCQAAAIKRLGRGPRVMVRV